MKEFKVPDGYFDHLPSRILHRIAEREQSAKYFPVTRYRYLTLKTLGIAISVMILISATLLLVITGKQYPYSRMEKPENPAVALAEYLNLDESAVIDLVTSEVPVSLLNLNGIGQSMVELNGEFITKDEIIEYLIEKDHPLSATYELTFSTFSNPTK